MFDHMRGKEEKKQKASASISIYTPLTEAFAACSVKPYTRSCASSGFAHQKLFFENSQRPGPGILTAYTRDDSYSSPTPLPVASGLCQDSLQQPAASANREIVFLAQLFINWRTGGDESRRKFLNEDTLWFRSS